MKIILRTVFIAISAVIIGYGCLCMGEYFTKSNSSQEEETPKVKMLSFDDYPKYSSTIETKEMADAFFKEFTNNKAENIIDDTDEQKGYVRLVNGDIDIFLGTKLSDEDLEYAKENKVELEMIPVAKEGLVFTVNEKNAVSSLTSKEIQDIYSKEITTWKTVKGKDAKIKVLQNSENTGAQLDIIFLVMKQKKIMDKVKENTFDTTDELLGEISDENAIACSYYRTVKKFKEENENNKIKILDIDEIEANEENIKNGKYPLITDYYIIIRKNEKEDSNVRKLVVDMLSSRGQNVIEKIGYIAVN